MKTCNKCGIEKDILQFGFNKKSKDGYQYCCKQCGKEKASKYYIENKEKIDNRNKEYNKGNKEKLYEYRRKYSKDNPEKEKTWKDNFNNKESTVLKKKEYKKKWREKNKESIKQKDKEYRLENKEKIRNRYLVYNKSEKRVIDRRKYIKDKYNNDPLYKLICNMRCSISKWFRKKGYSKPKNTHEILGCSYEEFKIHIESKFEPWMSWSNHGEYTGNYNETWQYDHIYPISLANNSDEVIKLNYFTNFQPLCSRKNYEKLNSIL